MTPGFFRDLKQQMIDCVLCDRADGLRLLWDIAERQCTDGQLRALRTMVRMARATMVLLPEEMLVG
jgi:hypothetical protein